MPKCEHCAAERQEVSDLLREIDLLRNELATYEDCGTLRLQALAEILGDQVRELANIRAGKAKK